MQPKFTKTVNLTTPVRQRIRTGSLVLRPGQWVRSADTGKRGRFINVNGNGTAVVCWHHAKEDFFGYSWRHAEGCWHNYRKQTSPELCVLGAPTATVPLTEVKRALRQFHTGPGRVYGSLIARKRAA